MTYQADLKILSKRKARLIDRILAAHKMYPRYSRNELQNLGLYQLEILHKNLPK